jgi:hypothetical protein
MQELLHKEVLLLLEHLRNPDSGDVDCIDSHVTDNHTTNESQIIAGEDLFQDAHEDVEDPDVYFQVDAPVGSSGRSQADPPRASDGSMGSGPSPLATRGGQETLRRQTLSVLCPSSPARRPQLADLLRRHLSHRRGRTDPLRRLRHHLLLIRLRHQKHQCLDRLQRQLDLLRHKFKVV